jgi:hypothetical protein
VQTLAKPAFLISSFVALAACGGAGGVSNAPPRSTTGTYQTLTSTAAVTSTQGGAALRINTTQVTVETAPVSGTLTHNTGETVFTDGVLSLTDPDGPNMQGELSDGVNTVDLITAGPGFEYVQAFNAAYSQGGTSFQSAGVAGVVTASSDMPNRGAATYSGRAEVLTGGDYGNLNFNVNSTNTTVTADFAAGRVNVDMRDLVGNVVNGIQVDRIQINNMIVSGNQISGGTQTYTFGGTPNAVFSSGQTAQGAFFGSDPVNGVPDEVGGVFKAETFGVGVLTGLFIAD